MVEHWILNEAKKEEVSELVNRLDDLAEARMQLIRSCNMQIETLTAFIEHSATHDYSIAEEQRCYSEYKEYTKRLKEKYQITPKKEDDFE